MPNVAKAGFDILSSSNGADTLTYWFVLDDGRIEGPRLEMRPADEDHQAFIDAQIPAMNAALNQVVLTEEERLKETLQGFSDEAIKSVTGMSDEKLDEIKGAKQ